MGENRGPTHPLKEDLVRWVLLMFILSLIAPMIDMMSDGAIGTTGESNQPPSFYSLKIEKAWVYPGERNNLSLHVQDDNTDSEDVIVEVCIKESHNETWIPFAPGVVGKYGHIRIFDISLPDGWSYGYYDVQVRAIDEEGNSTRWTLMMFAIHLINDNMNIDRLEVNKTSFDYDETLNIKIYFHQRNGSEKEIWFEIKLIPIIDLTAIIQNKVPVNTSNGYIEANWTLTYLKHGSHLLRARVWDGSGDFGYYELNESIIVNNIPAEIDEFDLDNNNIYRGEEIRGSFWIRDQDDDLSQNGVSLQIMNRSSSEAWRNSFRYSSPIIYHETGPIHERFIEFSFQTDENTEIGTYNITIDHWQWDHFNISMQLVILNNPPEFLDFKTRIEFNHSGSQQIHLNSLISDFEDSGLFVWNVSGIKGEELFEIILDQSPYEGYLTLIPKQNVTGEGSFYLIGTDSNGAGDEIRFDVIVNTSEIQQYPVNDDDNKTDDKNEENKVLQYVPIIIGVVLLLIIIVVALVILLIKKKDDETRISDETPQIPVPETTMQEDISIGNGPDQTS